jgi:hypothetical protein
MTYTVTVHKEWVFTDLQADDEAEAEQLALQYCNIEHASNTTVDVKPQMPQQLRDSFAKRLEGTADTER